MHRILLAAALAAATLPLGQVLARAQVLAQSTPLSRTPLPAFPEANPRPPPAGRPSPPARRAPVREAPAEARRPTPPPPLESAALARDLDAALAIDATARAIGGQRAAARSRDAQVRSPIAGSPALGSDFRSDARGPTRANEWNVEIAAPMWLPGQRGALAGTVTAGVEEQDRRLALRRLEIAGQLRDAFWAAGLAERERAVAQDRLATARDIGRDVTRRVELGDIPETEALLTRNEELAAALEVARAEAAVAAARGAYRTLTGGSDAALQPAAPAAAVPAGGPAALPPRAADGAQHPRSAPQPPRSPPLRRAPGWWRRRRSTIRSLASSRAARAGR